MPHLPALPDEGRHHAPATRAEIERLFRHTGMTTLAGVVVALCTWLLFYRYRPSMPVLVWALLIHGAQATTLLLLLAFRRDTGTSTGPSAWQRRHRIALALAAVGWGIAPVLLLGPDDLPHAALLVLVLLGMAVVGAIATATDRASIYLWLVPIATLLPLVLLWHGGDAYFALALVAVTWMAVHLRLALAQNHLLSSTLRAQLENAALVERLHQQMELTAQASREKSQFLASASHDLRQPLHALSFFGATLERRMAGSVDQPLIYNMMRSIEALDKSFGAILDISKLDAGAVEPHVQSFPIRDLFRRLQMSFAGQAEEAGLQLRFRLGAKVVTSDPQLLERDPRQPGAERPALQPPGRRRAGGGAAPTRRCQPRGLGRRHRHQRGRAAEGLRRVLPGRQPRARSRQGTGHGPGDRQAAERAARPRADGALASGRAAACSGSGCRASTRRRSTSSPSAPKRCRARSTTPAPSSSSTTRKPIRTSVGELLVEWGYEVIAVATTAEALAAAKARAGLIDVIVSDLRLRDGEDGLRAIEQIRQACGFDVPAVLVTGDTAPDQVLRVHESGHIVLYKPVQPKELLTVLKKLA